MSTTYYITIHIDDDVDYSQKIFENKVKKVLLDKDGWQSIAKVKFKFVGKDVFDKIQTNKKIVINLSTNDTINKKCGFGAEMLSCCDMSTKEVWINFYRWMNGSKHSKLNIYKYRDYVINHEVGHALGRLHTDCPCEDCPAPIMMQHTVSIGNCKPNNKPLKNE